jgi:hypothetical protein
MELICEEAAVIFSLHMLWIVYFVSHKDLCTENYIELLLSWISIVSKLTMMPAA